MTAATSVLFLCSVLPILSLAQLQGLCDLPGGELTVKIKCVSVHISILGTNPQTINLRGLDSMSTPIFPALIMA